MSSFANNVGFDETNRSRAEVSFGRLQDSFRFRLGFAATHGTESRTQGVRHPSGNEDGREEPKLHFYGWSCNVYKLKPGRLGCAIVEFDSAQVREEVMHSVQNNLADGVPHITIEGVIVRVRRHVEELRSTHSREVATSIFIAWPHASEKSSPLPERRIVDTFDIIVARLKAPHPSALPEPNLS
eukprot:TRINITY_DN19976_c0_g1_i1.p1 TRINITY_DN19976_c0_g1~~TRINITY_DN19976_c0_g1_i1.p1  ORF type:complete len:184 (-),score=8.44 TRINITY_DN19976_c0_g1_i1:135-686(-)